VLVRQRSQKEGYQWDIPLLIDSFMRISSLYLTEPYSRPLRMMANMKVIYKWIRVISRSAFNSQSLFIIEDGLGGVYDGSFTPLRTL